MLQVSHFVFVIICVHSANDYSSFFGWYDADAVAINAPILYTGTVSRSIYALCPALFQTLHTKNCERCVGGETNREITTQMHELASQKCVSFIEFKAPSLLVLVLLMLRYNVYRTLNSLRNSLCGAIERNLFAWFSLQHNSSDLCDGCTAKCTNL